jgi:predicted nicotinamide N-methyase
MKSIDCGPYTFRYSPKDADTEWNKIAALQVDSDYIKDERIPYWVELWPAAAGMATYLATRNVLIPGTTFHEIGCGLAIPSMVAARMGLSIMMSDYTPEACAMARSTWELNMDGPCPIYSMDWRHPDPKLNADVICACDVAYEKRAWPWLIHCFKMLLNPGGSILLSEPGRHMTTPFFELLKREGFNFTQEEVLIVFEGKENLIRIFCVETN